MKINDIQEKEIERTHLSHDIVGAQCATGNDFKR